MINKTQNQDIGVVIIGRNEGERLRNCIDSLREYNLPIIYVDSGSTDGSVQYCLSNGVNVVELDMSIPFTAARARNEGFKRLKSVDAEVCFVQFIDGDCQLDPNWLAKSKTFLETHTDYAAVCGRRRERYPDATIYNMLCDIEWDSPIGDAKACGGDVLMRVDALSMVGGYRPDVIAGEEPELCFRLREAGWKIYRLEAEMTLHDANITSFSQWWKRQQRAGYAYTNSAWIHRKSSEHFNQKPVLRILFWGILLPIIVLIASLMSPIWLFLLAVYGIQYSRLVVNGPTAPEINRYWAWFIIIGKFAEAKGLVKCVFDILLARKSAIIEYK